MMISDGGIWSELLSVRQFLIVHTVRHDIGGMNGKKSHI